MLQFNYVSISNGNRRILSDCTFQFQEGTLYVVVGEKEDFVTLFNCICKEKKTDSGEIVTWADMVVYNASDDTLMPGMLTGNEYISNLLLIKGSKRTLIEVADETGLDEDELNAVIESDSPVTKAKLRLAAMLAIDPYIMTFGEPFAERNVFCDVLRKYGEEKILIAGTSELSEAKKIAESTGAEIVLLRNERLDPLYLN